MDAITILIADDHPMFRFGLRARLETEPNLCVIGEAATGEEVVDFTVSLAPDVILMDLNLPGISGIEATRRIREIAPASAILFVTMSDDDSIFEAVRAGARGYLLKDADAEETVRAINAVAHGEAIFSPSVARRLQNYFAAPPPSVPVPIFPELTDRERDVLALIASGFTNQTIADRLFVSPKTVRNYVSNVFGKLQVADRAEAISRAREAGLGTKQQTK